MGIKNKKFNYLSYIEDITANIELLIDVFYGHYITNLFFKIELTPVNGRTELLSGELNMLRNKLLDHEGIFKEPIRMSSSEFIRYQSNKRNGCCTDIEEKRLEKWIGNFLGSLTGFIGFTFRHIYDEILDINVCALDELDRNETYDIACYINNDMAIALIECLSTISFYRYVYELHDNALNGILIETPYEKSKSKPNPENVGISIPRLQTNLTTGQRDKLFEQLKNGEFIPNTTDVDCFNWAICTTNEIEPTQPRQWKPIKWKKSKMAFVEVFLPFCNTITSRPTNKFIGLLFFDENDKAMKDLKKPGKDETSSDYGEICYIIDQLKP